MAGLQQFLRHDVHLSEAVVAEDDPQILVRVDERARHVVERDMKLGFPVRQILFSLLLLGDVGHHRDRATGRDPPAQDAVPAAVGRVVLEALPRRIAQTLHAPGDQGVGVALAVVAVLGQMAQKIGIGTAGSSNSSGTGYISRKRWLQTTIFRSLSV